MDPMAGLENAPLSEKLFAYILINYRWVFVLLFLLPLSLVYDAFFYVRNKIVFRLRSAPRQHDARVKDVQRQIAAWASSGSKQKLCTARPGWQNMSFRRGKYKKTHFNVSVNLIDILEVNTDAKTVRCEPMVSMGQLTATLLPLGWTIPIVPELDDLTVGGLVMGTGVETSSHTYGLFQHICESYELVLADGSLVTCSAKENSDLFYAVPWSYGTLGFLVSATIRLIPAHSFVRLTYIPCHTLDELSKTFAAESAKREENDFVEGLVYSAESGVVMVGKSTNQADPERINRIGDYWKPWFFKHVEKFLKTGGGVEFIPTRHYYHRHSRSIFWQMQDIVPFGNHPIFRYLLGWAVPPKVSLMKLTQGETVKKMYETHQIIQDMLVPITDLSEAIRVFHREINMYPLWLCPFYLPDNPGMLRPRDDRAQMYVDIGAYGAPKNAEYKAEATTRRLEAYVREVRGFQMLYADTFMSADEFEVMFDHRLYNRLRDKLARTKDAFPRVYEKINRSARD